MVLLERSWRVIASAWLRLWIWAALTISLASQQSTFPPQEYYALEDFFYATNGQYWTWIEPYSTYGIPWQFRGANETNPCAENWQGISCSAGNCTVEVCKVLQLSLPNHALDGALPASLVNLTYLQYLSLTNNMLQGHLPPQITGFKYLNYLDLSLNTLSGPLPSDIDMMPLLSTLNLYDCFFTGTMPQAFARLQNLATFQFYGNYLYGKFPSPWTNWTTIQTFAGFYNSLTGEIPPSIGLLTNMKSFNMQYNFLGGQIPDTIVGASALQTLQLAYNYLSGPFPDDFGQLQQLSTAVFSNNMLFGPLPSGWPESSALTSLTAPQNFLYGTLGGDLLKVAGLLTLILEENMLTGYLPTNVEAWTQLSTITLDRNMLSGTFPVEWCGLTSASTISMNLNSLSGPLPDCFNQMIYLAFFTAQKNFLSGPIPCSMSNLTALYHISLIQNHITGSVPECLVNATKLTLFDLSDNKLTGPIPANIGNWTSIFHFYIDANHMTGTIPDTICDPKSMDGVMLSNNHFNGSIPSTIGKCNIGTEFYFFNNLLTGSIPDSVGELSSLSILLLFNNMITGTFPPSMLAIDTVIMISVANNLMHGNVSNVLTSMPKLMVLDTANNLFTGTIDFGTHKQEDLIILDIGRNEMTGTIPPNIGHLFLTEMVFIDGNQFHGTLPVNLSSLQFWEYANLSSNYFYGHVQGFIPIDGDLGYVAMANNLFSGTIGNVFNQLRNLFILELHSNAFTGGIGELIDPAYQIHLVKIDVSSNALTGSLPDSWFGGLTVFESFVAAINCFTGSIPDGLCMAGNLSSLILDGLHASQACNRRIFPWQSASVYALAPGVVSGGIPDCLFAMANLETLHISGNGISGSLHGNLTVSLSLTDLSLSHNALSGVIPPTMFSHFFDSLDLSFNRFCGVLPSGIQVYKYNTSANTSASSSSSVSTDLFGLSSSSVSDTSSDAVIAYTQLNLQVNRLSGPVPSILQNLPDINILDGNMFSCDMNGDDLPKYDPNFDSYQCGSDVVNGSLIAWMIFAVVAGSALLWRWRQAQQGEESSSLWQQTQSWRQQLHKDIAIIRNDDSGKQVEEHCSFHELAKENYQTVQLVLIITFYLLVIMMISYGALTVFYGTFNNQYAWTVSLTFLKGTNATVVLAVLLTGLVVLMMVLRECLFTRLHSAVELEVVSDATAVAEVAWYHTVGIEVRKMSMLAAVVVVNCVVVLLANIGYVLAFSQSLPLHELLFVSLAISLFKLVWGNVIVVHAIGAVVQECCSPSWHLFLLVAISVFNNIVAPYVAEGFVSPNCFQYALQSPPAVTSTFSTVACYITTPGGHLNLTVHCGAVAPPQFTFYLASSGVPESTVHFDPPFIYSYQCSSSLLTAFAYVFVIRYLLSGILHPVLIILLKRTQRVLWKQFGSRASSVWFTTRLLPLLFRLMPLESSAEHEWNVELLHSAPRGPQVMSRAFSVRLLSDLAVLCTFGVLFPPLALVIAVSMCIDIWIVESALGYCLQLFQTVTSNTTLSSSVANTENDDDVSKQREQMALLVWTRTVRQLHTIYSRSLGSLPGMLPALICFAAVFWSFSLYDTLGNTLGAVSGVWAVLGICGLPPCLFFLRAAWRTAMTPIPASSSSAPQDTSDDESAVKHADASVVDSPVHSMVASSAPIRVPGVSSSTAIGQQTIAGSTGSNAIASSGRSSVTLVTNPLTAGMWTLSASQQQERTVSSMASSPLSSSVPRGSWLASARQSSVASAASTAPRASRDSVDDTAL